MLLHFIGTGNAQPRPDRGQTCLLVQAEGSSVVIDCGDGAATRLWTDPDLDWGTLRALLLTHLHPDHAAGLLTLLHLLHMRASSHPEWEIVNNTPFYLALPRCQHSRMVVDVLAAFHLEPSRLHFGLEPDYYAAGQPFTAGPLQITPWPTGHTPEAHGFSIEHAGQRVVVTGDIGDLDTLRAQAAGATAIVTECAHFWPADLAEALRGCDCGQVVVTHMRDELLDLGPAAIERFAALAAERPVTLATDGMQLEL